MAEPLSADEQTRIRTLVTVFTRIGEERMKDLGLYNPALAVEAVGFRPWNGWLAGILVTPWFMNFMLLPVDPANGLAGVEPGSRRRVTLPKGEGQRVLQALTAEKNEAGFANLLYDDQIGKLAVVGAGMRTNAGVSAQLFTALSDAGINIEMISTSEIRISVVTRADTLAEAMRVVHTAFGLDSDDIAQVHGGTGR